MVWHGRRYDSTERVHCVFSTCIDWVSDSTAMSLWLIQSPCDFSTCVDSVSGVTEMSLPIQSPCDFSTCVDSVNWVTEMSLLNKSPCFWSTCVDSLSGVTGRSPPNLWKSIVSSVHVVSESMMWQGCPYPANQIPLCLLYMWWSIWVSDVTRMSTQRRFHVASVHDGCRYDSTDSPLCLQHMCWLSRWCDRDVTIQLCLYVPPVHVLTQSVR